MGHISTTHDEPSDLLAYTDSNHSKRRTETGDLKVSEVLPLSIKFVLRMPLQLEASMCRLRGILYQRLNQQQLAKQSFMEALALDVRNFDVFLELTNSMMTVEEGS